MNIELSMDSFTILLGGLYAYTHNVHVYAIPPEVYKYAAELLVDYLDDWDYSKLSFEDFIENNLLIIPIELVDKTEYENNTIYSEYVAGRITFMITAEIIM